MTRVAAILSIHERPEKSLRCIEHLLKNESKSLNIDVFISDSSINNSAETLLKNRFPDIYYEKVNNNYYWNQAMINSWKRSVKVNPEFFLLLNDDTYLKNNVIKNMINEYNSIKEPSIIVGATSFNGKITYGGRIDKIKDMPAIPNNSTQEVRYINGNCVLINKIVFNRVGYLNSKFSHSLGDLDYGLRARKLGIKSYLSSEVVGECKKNKNVWYNKKNIVERYKLLRSPKGVPLKEYFYFNYSHFGIFKAFKFIIATIFALIFPKLYKLSK